jgi:hypothetical protein
MTPTTSAFEDRLLDALLDRFDAMAPSPPPSSSRRRVGPASGATPYRWGAWPPRPRRRR